MKERRWAGWVGVSKAGSPGVFRENRALDLPFLSPPHLVTGEQPLGSLGGCGHGFESVVGLLAV